MRATCMTCRWAVEADPARFEDVDGFDLGTMECHRHPPMPVDVGGDGFTCEWPLVDALDFCGDHEPGEVR